MNISLARCAGAFIAGAAALAATTADAIVMTKNADASQKVVQVPATAPTVLPDKGEVLSVDWVDARNFRLAIGGTTYSVRDAAPDITLPNGDHSTNIGYLKHGTKVRVTLASRPDGSSRLAAIRVVAAAADAAAPGSGPPTSDAPR